MPYEELFSDLDFQQATETSRSSPSSASWTRRFRDAGCPESVGANSRSSSSPPRRRAYASLRGPSEPDRARSQKR